MLQLLQDFKTGKLEVKDIPQPSVSEGMVLVRNLYSTISCGTEKSTVDVAKASLAGKAKKRPDLVKQVFDNIRREGFKATIDKIKLRLDTPKALGYSSCGVVIESRAKYKDLKVGDIVACAGQDFASHAEVIAVPERLLVKVPENVSYQEASITTMGAIALQGVRQAEPKLGENICVIGLGLLGLITCQYLKASGCRVMGVDLSDELIKLAKKSDVDFAVNRNNENFENIILSFTEGMGFDTVIITAGTSSNDPINIAAKICRKKGKVVVVGSVGMQIQRDPYYYKKELTLLMSCSYGPGRYDNNYEFNGIDYPYHYVRFTEERNMETFLYLLSDNKIKLKEYITHVFDIKEAYKAYDIILGKIPQFYLGMLIEYPENIKHYKENTLHKLESKTSCTDLVKLSKDKLNIAFVGAGNFAQSYLIPNLDKDKVNKHTVVTSKGFTAASVAKKFGFAACSTDYNKIIDNDDIDAFFVATRHNLHSSIALNAIKRNKAVFVEKPLLINNDELLEWKKYLTANNMDSVKLFIGFNRRFSTASNLIKKDLIGLNIPSVINIRINAGKIPMDHWIHDETSGGGRIIGEICHFIDLVQYFSDSKITKVHAFGISQEKQTARQIDNLVINLFCQDGTIATISYLSEGDKSLPKEYIEVHCAGNSYVIEDFKNINVHKKNTKKKIVIKGKGHREEVKTFIDCVKDNRVMPLSADYILNNMETCFNIIKSLENNSLIENKY